MTLANPRRISLAIWCCSALVIMVILVSQILNGIAFQRSREEGAELRKILCQDSSLRNSQYCRIIRGEEKSDALPLPMAALD